MDFISLKSRYILLRSPILYIDNIVKVYASAWSYFIYRMYIYGCILLLNVLHLWSCLNHMYQNIFDHAFNILGVPRMVFDEIFEKIG